MMRHYTLFSLTGDYCCYEVVRTGSKLVWVGGGGGQWRLEVVVVGVLGKVEL